jgi:hypothetical protein
MKSHQSLWRFALRRKDRKAIAWFTLLGLFVCMSSGCTSTSQRINQHYPIVAPGSSKGITATGYAVIASQRGDTEAQQRLMAIKASKLDAYRSLTEQVYGQWIDASDNLVDFALSEDQLKARVEGVIYGARLVSITPIGTETYETKLSLDQRTVNEIIQNYLGDRKSNSRTRDAEIRSRRLITSNETR